MDSQNVISEPRPHRAPLICRRCCLGSKSQRKKAIDDDVKDAKRRVNAAKGPKKKTNKALPAEDASDAASEAADSEA